MNDLPPVINVMTNRLLNGLQYYENVYQSAKYCYEIEYIENTDYIEKEINGKFYRVFKSNF